MLVRALLVNSGDGALHGARVVLEPPAGCIMRSAEPAVLAIPVLEPGARFAAEATARVVAAASSVRADGGYVIFADGSRASVAAGDELVHGAVLDAPTVRVAAERRAARVEATIGNAGWADAHDVMVGVTLPPGARLEGGVEVDGIAIATRRRPAQQAGVFASLRSLGAAHEIRIARLPARSQIAIVLRVVVQSAAADVNDTICSVSVAGMETRAFIAVTTVRDVRLRVAEAPHRIDAAGAARVVIEALNAGDAAEHITLEIEPVEDAAHGAAARATTLAPGMLCAMPLVMQAPAAADGAVVTARVIARDRDGLACAEVPLTFAVRSRCWIAMIEAPVPSGAAVRYRCAHRGIGEAALLHVRWNNGDDLPLAHVATGSTFDVDADLAAARSGGAIVTADGVALCELPPFEPAAHAAPAIALAIDRELAAGGAFITRAVIEVTEPLERLSLRVVISGCTYAAGSTRLDGHQLLDRDGEPGLPIRDLVMRGIPAQRSIVLEWTCIADRGEREACIAVHANTGAAPATIAAVQASISPGASFALRPAGLAYHVEARTTAAPSDDAPASFAQHAQAAEPTAAPAFAWLATVTNASLSAKQWGAPVLEIALDARRIAEFTALLGSEHGATLAHHVVAVRALLPDRVRGDDDRMQTALLRTRDAARDVFDRLYVKLRIPGFEPIAADLEDSAMRNALIALYDALLTAPNVSDAEPAEAVHTGALAALHARPTHEQLHAMLGGFADAPFGSADTLRALFALAPTSSERGDPIGDALIAYARELSSALEPFAREPLAAFEDALAGPPTFALTSARRVLAAAVRAHAPAGAV